MYGAPLPCVRNRSSQWSVQGRSSGNQYRIFFLSPFRHATFCNLVVFVLLFFRWAAESKSIKIHSFHGLFVILYMLQSGKCSKFLIKINCSFAMFGNLAICLYIVTATDYCKHTMYTIFVGNCTFETSIHIPQRLTKEDTLQKGQSMICRNT